MFDYIDTGEKLWVDDLRQAPDGWVWVKSSSEAIDWLCDHTPAEISFDHDLGGNDTSMKIANYIEIWASRGFIDRFTWHIHSANPVGKKNLKLAFTSIEQFWSERERANV